MYENSVLLSMPKKENLDLFVYKYLFQNLLDIEANEQTFKDKWDRIGKWDEKNFIKAFNDRTALEKEMGIEKLLLKSDPWILRDFSIKNKILNVVNEELMNYACNLSEILKILLTIKTTKEENWERKQEDGLLEFLREKVILEQINDFFSERFLRRFLAKLKWLQKSRISINHETFKHAMMNTIWEFILISLGIISPEMFKLYRFKIDEEKIADLIKNTNCTKDELVELFKYYDLRWVHGEPIFYNRRFTKNQIPSKNTDNLVRDFLMKMREHEETIFESFWYEEFVSKIISTKKNKELDWEEKTDMIIGELTQRLWNENFTKEVLNILVKYKYKNIFSFIEPSK